MKFLFQALIIVFILGIISCKDSKSPRELSIERIQTWEKKADTTASKEENIIGICDSLIAQYENFVQAFPSDTFVGICLQRVSALHLRLSRYEKAIDALERMAKLSPNSKQIPFIKFQEGMIYQTNLGQLGKAKEIFNEIILKYPQSTWAEQSKIMVQSNATNDMELFKEQVINKPTQEQVKR